MKHTVRRCLLLLIALFSVGCNRISWKEEVQLGSGEIIIVQRSAKVAPLGNLGVSAGWENEGMTVEVIEPKLADKPPI